MEKYLDKCLSSLIVDEAAMQLLEVLVVNDGSTDSSSEIAHKYESNYPSLFRVIDKKNGNYGSCVNVGLKHTTGKYFRILDADDWFDTEALIYFLKALENTDADLVFTAMNTHSDEGIVYESSSNIFKEGIIYEANKIKCNVDDISIHMHTMTFKRDILDQCHLKLSEGVSYSDTEYCYFPLHFCKSIVFFPYCLYQYLLGREGQTMSYASKKQSLKSMTVVSARLALDYSKKSIHEGLLDAIQYELVTRVLSMLYYFGIVELPKSDETDEFIRNTDQFVKRDARLNDYSKSLLRSRLPYIIVWRYTGLHENNDLMRLYHRIFTFAKNIYYRFIKKQV